jgi:hypothetical protein
MANDSSTNRFIYIFSTGFLTHSVPKNTCIFDASSAWMGGEWVSSHDSDVEIFLQQIPLASTFYYGEVLGLSSRSNIFFAHGRREIIV